MASGTGMGKGKRIRWEDRRGVREHHLERGERMVGGYSPSQKLLVCRSSIGACLATGLMRFITCRLVIKAFGTLWGAPPCRSGIRHFDLD